MENNNEIKQANRKAMPKFLLIMAVSAVIGGMTGFFAAKYGFHEFSSSLRSGGEAFGMYAAPWLMLAVALIVPLISLPLYRQAGKLLRAWDGEDEEVSDAIDRKLSIIIWITSAALVVSYFLIAASYSRGFATFEEKGNPVAFIVGIAAFFAILFESVLLQQKCVDAAKKTNPEKTASVYDTRFQKKWMESCDEAEKILIGKCAIQACNATNTICCILSIALAICALIFGTGFLPSLVVCVVWLTNLSVYSREALKYSKAGHRIS